MHTNVEKMLVLANAGDDFRALFAGEPCNITAIRFRIDRREDSLSQDNVRAQQCSQVLRDLERATARYAREYQTFKPQLDRLSARNHPIEHVMGLLAKRNAYEFLLADADNTRREIEAEAGDALAKVRAVEAVHSLAAHYLEGTMPSAALARVFDVELADLLTPQLAQTIQARKRAHLSLLEEHKQEEEQHRQQLETARAAREQQIKAELKAKIQEAKTTDKAIIVAKRLYNWQPPDVLRELCEGRGNLSLARQSLTLLEARQNDPQLDDVGKIYLARLLAHARFCVEAYAEADSTKPVYTKKLAPYSQMEKAEENARAAAAR